MVQKKTPASCTRGQQKVVLRKFYYVPFSSNIKWPRLPECRRKEFDGIRTAVVYEQAEKAVKEIFFRAVSGEQAAIKILQLLAVEATNYLNSLIREHPEFVKKRACWWPVLPVLASPKHENAESIKNLMRTIGLGSKLGRAFRTRSRINFDLPVTVYAEAVKETIDINQALILLSESNPEIAQIGLNCKEVPAWPQWVRSLKKLPRLHDLFSNQATTTRSHFEDFWKVGKQALLETHPQPEIIKEFKPVLAVMAQSLTQAQQRARILSQIKQSFMSILKASIVK